MKKDIIVILILLSIFVAIGILLVSATTTPVTSTFYGSVKISGSNAPVGTVIKAYIASAECGSFTVISEGWYIIPVFPNDTDYPGCGEENDKVTFTINEGDAGTTGIWHKDTLLTPGQVLDLDTNPPIGCSLTADCSACTDWVSATRPHGAPGSCTGDGCVRNSGVGHYDQACCNGKVSGIISP